MNPTPDDRPRGHSAGTPGRPASAPLLQRLAELEALDRPAQRVAKAVRDTLGTGSVKDTLSGTQIGHALHPMLSDVPIGMWTSACLLDLIGGRQSAQAAERLIAVGIVAALPTAASGLSDWADTTVADREVTRIGALHAVSNVAALVLYGASWTARRRGHAAPARMLAMAGLGALGAGGYLGGHLAFNSAVGVDHTAFEDLPQDWVDAAPVDELSEGGGHLAHIAGVPVLLVQDGGEVLAIADHCCHRGGPLHEGEIKDGCVSCPWHGSIFRLRDGSVVRGPAAMPQPVLDTRVREGRVEVRAANSP